MKAHPYPSEAISIQQSQGHRVSPCTIIISLLIGLLSNNASAYADTLTLGNYWHPFYVSAVNLVPRPGELTNFSHIQDMGGNAMAVLNGELLVGAYCVGITDTIYLNSSYNATVVNNSGTVFGETINNAGAISWLMKNFAPTASTVDQQNALQAAIWRTEYGSAFQLDGADNNLTGNSASLISNYKSYLTALGNNTAPVADMLWISAYTAPGQVNAPPAPPSAHYQGLVGMRSPSAANSVPEPGSILLSLTGGIALIGVAARRIRR